MSVESLNPEPIEKHGPEFYSSFPVTYTPENAQNVAGLLNKIMAFEISRGERSDVHDPSTADNLDTLQRGFMIASQQKTPTPIPMSEANVADIVGHFEKYAQAKELTEDEKEAASRALLTMDVSLRNVRTAAPPPKAPDQFGFGPNSIAGEWARKRAEKGSKDGLG